MQAPLWLLRGFSGLEDERGCDGEPSRPDASPREREIEMSLSDLRHRIISANDALELPELDRSLAAGIADLLFDTRIKRLRIDGLLDARPFVGGALPSTLQVRSAASYGCVAECVDI